MNKIPFRLGSSREEILKPQLEAAIFEAKQHVKEIDGIVFPEMALTTHEYQMVLKIARENRAFLFCGTLNDPDIQQDFQTKSEAPAQNMCIIDFYGFYKKLQPDLDAEDLFKAFTLKQMKHHRWILNRSQIMQYGLGGILSPSKNWWEYSEVGKREVHFITFDEWMTVCALICEDLARQDPVANVIRSVGPNLVIALLMDGPQLKYRWSSRYASVLTDDPGCSVLCFTSLGMSMLSQPLDGSFQEPSRVIGLWRDIRTGERELRLEKGKRAGILSLSPSKAREWTADGRCHGSGFFPIFSGFHQLECERTNPRIEGTKA